MTTPVPFLSGEKLEEKLESWARQVSVTPVSPLYHVQCFVTSAVKTSLDSDTDCVSRHVLHCVVTCNTDPFKKEDAFTRLLLQKDS